MTVSRSRPADKVSDIDLSHWQQYHDILTDSLWILDARDSSGAHRADYHGNFIPQIPNQLLRRFTKVGDIVLDPFLGSGTTAIEANRLARRWIGIELSEKVSDLARWRIQDDLERYNDRLPFPEDQERFEAKKDGEEHAYSVGTWNDTDNILLGDSSSQEVADKIGDKLGDMGSEFIQFILMHPPYHDIIRFSDNPADLSNCQDTDVFLERFLSVYSNVSSFLEAGRYLAVVIGDIYANSEWIPLQNMVTSVLLSKGELRLKSIIVKNMMNNRAKRNQENLWRYRALANGFYIFKHEYIVLFQKTMRQFN